MEPLPGGFWARVDTSAECWLWQGAADEYGYGLYRRGDNRAYRTHRLAYAELRGPIPPGLVLDHLCRVRRCLNPAHLEPVTQSENARRMHVAKARGLASSEPPTRISATKALCKRGHPYAELRYPNGSRKCGPCAIAREERYRPINAANHRRYRREDPEQVRARQRARHARRKAIDPAYTERVRAANRAYGAEWRADPANRQRKNAYRREWRARRRAAGLPAS